MFHVTQSIKLFGQLSPCIIFIFCSATSGVRQFYLVLWQTEINGLIEKPQEEEMASANEKLVCLLMDVSVPSSYCCAP